MSSRTVRFRRRTPEDHARRAARSWRSQLAQLIGEGLASAALRVGEPLLAFDLEPFDLLARIPPPRLHTARYHGVLSSRAKLTPSYAALRTFCRLDLPSR